jgi:uncharacterized membrane protein YdjX (TVP38/TMEM64 family)
MKSKKRFVFFILFVIMSVFVAVFSSYLSSVQSYIESFVILNSALASFIYNIIFISSTTFSFPLTIMMSIGVLFFSIPLVILYSTIGIMASSIIDFYISRKLGKTYIRNYIEKKGGRLEKFDGIIEKNPFKLILILSAVYFVPPAIPNFLGGIININLKKYSIATFIGNFPNVVFGVLLLHGIIYPNPAEIYISVIGLVTTSLIALLFYTGEIKELFFISFPFMRKLQRKKKE